MYSSLYQNKRLKVVEDSCYNMQDEFNDTLEKSWNDFKGSTENFTVEEARKMLETVETARTTTAPHHQVDAVTIFLDPDSTIIDEIHSVVDRHNLVLIHTEENSHHTELTFTTEELADANSIETLELN